MLKREHVMKEMTVTTIAAIVHKANQKWWVDPHTEEPIIRNKGEMIALMLSEVAELVDGYSTMDDHLPQYSTPTVELIDLFIRLMDYIGGHKIDILVQSWEEWLNECAQAHPIFISSDRGAVNLLIRLVELLEVERKHHTDSDRITAACENVLQVIAEQASDLGLTPDTFAEVFTAKMDYNANRADHKLENRRKPGGKLI